MGAAAFVLTRKGQAFTLSANVLDIIAETIGALGGQHTKGRAVPRYLPNGAEVKTVAQLAALMGVDEKVAAAYAIEQSWADEALLAEAKGFYPQADDEYGGIAIMFYPDPSDAKQLSLTEGTSAPDLHITLGYFGKTEAGGGTVDDAEFREDLLYVTREVAARLKPFEVNINGIARFSADDNDPVVALADSPVLEDARRMLVEVCESENIKLVRNHGYTPHMTLGFADHDTDIPLRRWIPRKIRITNIVLGYGRDYTYIDLGTDEQKDVYNAAIGPVSSLRSSVFVVDRITGRVKRIRQKNKHRRKKGPEN